MSLSKDEFLQHLQANRQVLLQLFDDVPETALTTPHTIGAWRVIDVLAATTAWDGETLRRLDFATGERSQPPHDVTDEGYWQVWLEEQVRVKRVMGPRGIKVDMAGTWIRLLARIEALSPHEYARWLDSDPQATPNRDQPYIAQLRAWRQQWERSLPWWRRMYRLLFR